MHRGADPKHMLWGLLFMKVYSTEEAHSTVCGISRNTFRKWSWLMLNLISGIKIVSSTFNVILMTNTMY